ncbi:TPA: archaeal proteasome endopeptidase complex subunit alpha [Candidatus Geothermarchaeota archaeon]|nr:archaeal proteasome endopeptidase complex subunit alpha [Candidatus Geothermarchaeota archaeon]
MFPSQAAYDRAITVFSPDGRIFQVEYALETVKRGTLSIGALSNHGVVLSAEESFSKFQDKNYSRKLFIIDENIGGVISGYVPDGRVLIDYAREFCQYQRILYDEPPYVEVVARRIGNIKQGYTQQGGIRPFGVSIIFGGLNPDGTPVIFVTDPSGSCIKYSVAAIGSNTDVAIEFIDKHYDQNMSIEDLKILLTAATIVATKKKEEFYIRFLEIDKETRKAKYEDIEKSAEYVNKAVEKYNLT